MMSNVIEKEIVEDEKTRKVLDKGYVRLVDVMGSDLSVVNAARASYAKESQEFTDKDIGLVKFLANNNHMSPFRHAAMTFEFKAPLMVARQHWKYVVGSDHTMDSWNESSRRYITSEPEFNVPGQFEWRAAPDNSKQGSGEPLDEVAGVMLTASLEGFIEDALARYDWALKLGVAPEQARLFLPAYGMFLYYRWTCSLQSVSHFLKERLAHDAQNEITQYARATYDLIKDRFPVSFEALIGEVDA